MIDRNSYEKLWDNGIVPAINKYKSACPLLSIHPNAKELIWNNYYEFNEQCKKNYMINPEDKIDRHKVCACYIYAIVKSHVITVENITDNEDSFLLVNEFIAISIGLSLLRAFIILNAKTSNDITAEKKRSTISKVFNGIRIPECNHGEYLSNFATELYYTRQENTYNILSLAHTLFLLEIHSTETEKINDWNLKKKNKKRKR